MIYVQIIVDLHAQNVDRLYTYRAQDAPIGSRVLVPFGKRTLAGFVVARMDAPDIEEHLIRDVIRILDEMPAVQPGLITLAWWMKERYRCLLVDALRLMIPAQMRTGDVQPLLLLHARVVDRTRPFGDGKRAPKQAALYALLADKPDGMWVYEMGEGALSPLRGLESKGYIIIEHRERMRSPFTAVAPPGADFTPTPRQQAAIDSVKAAMNGAGGAFLLHGVTGSGKTEVYIHLIREAMRMGKNAIVLVPEIALTPQMVDWFRSRFDKNAALLHSRLSAGERYDEWRRIRRGDARVVVGPRSALFAPFDRLALIIMDEEHETSYISEQTPRYDAHEVALERARIEGATLLLGSATPLLDTYARAMRGHYTLLELSERINGMPLPDVRIVDMTEELLRGNRSIFSKTLKDALSKCFNEGGQAMLLLNRRGYNTTVSCRACGASIKCGHCDVTMTFHQAENLLKCHYCDASQPPPATCPRCGSPFIRYFGIGTQKVEEEFRKLFPGIDCIRMDNDTTRTKDSHMKLLARFRSGEARALIGTQMIAKGHDFPRVTLVGLIIADLSLNVPDYRSEERTFALIVQMAGRAGRGAQGGSVIVQSYQPGHYAIAMAAKQDYRAFYHTEMQRRKRALYPPYTTLARLLVEDDLQSRAAATASALEQRLIEAINARAKLPDQIIQIRALECPLGRIKDKARWQVFIKLYAKGPAQEVLDVAFALTREEWPSEVTLEINPSSFL